MRWPQSHVQRMEVGPYFYDDDTVKIIFVHSNREFGPGSTFGRHDFRDSAANCHERAIVKGELSSNAKRAREKRTERKYCSVFREKRKRASEV